MGNISFATGVLNRMSIVEVSSIHHVERGKKE